VRLEGRRIVVRYESGTCNASITPRPVARVTETSSSVSVTVLLHVVKPGGHLVCGGVGLIGTLTAKLSRPPGRREIVHGTVTDHDQ
jgi:hypothetical protein